ncbi:MAG: CC_3452 family protein [Sphingomonas sp.]
MTRVVPIVAAAVAALSFPAAAAQAQPRGVYYVAMPSAAPASDSFVTRDTIWSCNDHACVADKAADRADVMCQRVAKQLGKLDSFTAGGNALDAEALARCNSHAR